MSSKSPSMFGNNKLKFDHSLNVILELELEKDSFYFEIKQITSKYSEKGRPVLIFFRDNETLDFFKDKSGHIPQDISKILVINQQTQYL